jgi:lipid-A-disaccharide synthase
MVKAPYAGMVNILAGRPVVKELLQKRAMPINVAAEALSLLKSEKAYAHLKTGLAEVKDMLKPEGAAQKFAEYILSSI